MLYLCMCEKQRKMYLSMWNHANKLHTKSRKTQIRTLKSYLVLKKIQFTATCSNSTSQETYTAPHRSSPRLLLLAYLYFLQYKSLKVGKRHLTLFFLVYIKGNGAFRFPPYIFENFKCQSYALALWGHWTGDTVLVPYQRVPVLQAPLVLVGFPAILHWL